MLSGWELQRHLAPPWRRHWICHCKYTYSNNSSVISEQICCRWRILIKTNKIKSLNDYENVIKSGKDPASGVLMKADLWSASPWRTAEATRAPRDVSVLVSAAEPNRAELRWDTAGRGNREGDTPLEAVSALHWYTNLSEIRSVCDGGGDSRPHCRSDNPADSCPLVPVMITHVLPPSHPSHPSLPHTGRIPFAGVPPGDHLPLCGHHVI